MGQMIYWQVPLHITPLMSLEVEILEVHMGINGRRLTPDEMESRNYAVTFKESHVVVEIPIGASDGYYKVKLSTVFCFPFNLKVMNKTFLLITESRS